MTPFETAVLALFLALLKWTTFAVVILATVVTGAGLLRSLYEGANKKDQDLYWQAQFDKKPLRWRAPLVMAGSSTLLIVLVFLAVAWVAVTLDRIDNPEHFRVPAEQEMKR